MVKLIRVPIADDQLRARQGLRALTCHVPNPTMDLLIGLIAIMQK